MLKVVQDVFNGQDSEDEYHSLINTFHRPIGN